jgi:hypothetical protein
VRKILRKKEEVMKAEDEAIKEIQNAIYEYYSELRCEEQAPTALKRLLDVLFGQTQTLVEIECMNIISKQFSESLLKKKEEV